MYFILDLIMKWGAQQCQHFKKAAEEKGAKSVGEDFCTFR
jgi:hypothetical protein